MKSSKIKAVVLAVVVLAVLAGCNENITGNKYSTNTNLMSATKAPTAEATQDNENNLMPSATEQVETTDPNESTKLGEAVDYDLTTMGSDMVYAMVYQLMVNPDDYIGKTFRMKGNYYSGYLMCSKKLKKISRAFSKSHV